MNQSLVKLKQRVVQKFAESVGQRVRDMGRDKGMESWEVVSKEMGEYLRQRKKLLGVLAEISIV